MTSVRVLWGEFRRAARHRSTDPACIYWRRPRWVWERIRERRTRGKRCIMCASGVI